MAGTPAYVQNAHNARTTQGTTLVASFPAGIVAGHLILMFVTVNASGGITRTPTTPTGFTQYINGGSNLFASGANAQLFLYWAVAQGNDTGPTITIDGNGWIFQVCVEVSNGNTTNPFDAGGPQITVLPASFSGTSPAITTQTANTLVVHLAANLFNGASITGRPATSRFDVGEATQGAELAWSDQVAATAGTIGTVNWSKGDNSLPWLTATVALNAPSIATTGKSAGAIGRSILTRQALEAAAKQKPPKPPKPPKGPPPPPPPPVQPPPVLPPRHPGDDVPPRLT